MNPLSPFIFYRRHKPQTFLLVSLITSVTLGICLIVGILYPILEHSSSVILGPLTHFSLAYPTNSLSPDPTVVAQIRVHPDVLLVIPENGSGLFINVPSLVVSSSFRVFGLPESDAPILLDACGLRLKEGRLLSTRTNEIVLSEEIANALGLRIGDQIDRSVDERYYWGIRSPLVLVGILESDPSVEAEKKAHVAITSYEYLASHELYAPRQSGLLIIAKQGRKAAVDEFLESEVRSPRTSVETHTQKTMLLSDFYRTTNLILGVVDCLVAVIVALVVGMINQIALAQRLVDLGVLNAIGFHKNRLIRRLTMETAIVAGAGWLTGLALSWLALAWLKVNFFAPRGIELNQANLAPIWFALPILLSVIGFAVLSIVRVFARFDAVAIIERGVLSTESASHERTKRPSTMGRSSVKPLSPWTFYLRHRRRGFILVLVMGSMILGVAFPAFFFSPMIDAQASFLINHLRYVAEVGSSAGIAVDPGVFGQIRSHPSVDRVIPASSLGLSVSVPPVSRITVTLYGVSEDDLLYLMDSFELILAEGRLPRPRSNEILLSEALAKNRGLQVGDTIGRPVDERDRNIPTEMVIVGTLRARSGKYLSSYDAVSLGFVSLEYLESHELYASHPALLLVVPIEGRKAEMDRWLEESVASTRTIVATYNTQLHDLQQSARGFFSLIAAVESIIVIVAATALAALNYIYFNQRREEFGVLHAVGHSRPWLLLRTTKETVSLVAVAWLIGALACMLSLIYAQAKIYAPIGLNLNFFNLSPWLFTLPIPLAVVAASAGTIARMLTKLDTVSIIERR